MQLLIYRPHRFSTWFMHLALIKNRQWIQDHWQIMLKRYHNSLADDIDLIAIGNRWKVIDFSGKMQIDNANQIIYIDTSTQDIQNASINLKRWLNNQAKIHLPKMIKQASIQHNLPYGRLQIRHQKQRWGSCNQHGDICLNQKLLFLPRDMAFHVILHELAHTVHCNHSQAFWSLLHQLDPNTCFHRMALNKAHDFIPYWAY